jgi:hypothetical protein
MTPSPRPRLVFPIGSSLRRYEGRIPRTRTFTSGGPETNMYVTLGDTGSHQWQSLNILKCSCTFRGIMSDGFINKVCLFGLTNVHY